MTFSEFVDRFQVRRSGKGWLMRCPAHQDRKPSLSISEGREGCVLLKCQAGCDLDAVLAGLGIEKKDLFPERPFASTAKPKPQRQAAGKTSPVIDWPGKRIRLVRARVPFGGKIVDAIRIETATPKPKPTLKRRRSDDSIL
jgi:hypothetical protein